MEKVEERNYEVGLTTKRLKARKKRKLWKVKGPITEMRSSVD